MRSFFKGWYFKIQSKRESVAFIPSFSADASGQKSASIQLVTADFSDCADFDYVDFHKEEPGFPPQVRIGNSEFSARNVKLDLKLRAVKSKASFFSDRLQGRSTVLWAPFRLSRLWNADTVFTAC